MDHHERGEGKEHFFTSTLTGSSNSQSSANGNPAISRSGYKAAEGSVSRFDFSSDDILSNYDYSKKQTFSDGHHVAPSRMSNSSTDAYMTSSRSDRFWEPKNLKQFANQQMQEDDNLYSEVVATVERTMKKYADNLLKVLEGMTGRLAQLELVNQRLERSVEEMRADVAHNHSEADERFRFLDNHIQEVHKAVQILRDKQEIAEAQTELVKLQLARKESSNNLHGSEDKSHASSSLSEGKQEHTFQPQSIQSQLRPSLPALPALPSPQYLATPHPPVPNSDQCQTPPQQQQPAQANMVQQSPVTSLPQQQAGQLQQIPNVMPMQSYYQQSPQQQGQIHQSPHAPQATLLPHIQQSLQLPPQQSQHLPYINQPPHIHNIPNQSVQPQVQRSQVQQLPQQQTQIQPQSLSQQPHFQQQAQLRPNIYQGQTHGVSPEAFSYQGVTSGISSEPSMYNYGSPSQTIQPSSQGPLHTQTLRPQLSQGGSQISDNSSVSSSQVPPPPIHPMHGFSTYNLPPRPLTNPYGTFSTGPQMSPFPGTYTRFPSAQQAQQYAQTTGNMVSNSGGGHLPSGHAYDELVEQVAGMGFSGDQIRGVIQRLTENGQPVDMNTVLDRLNSSTAGPSQRGWYN